MTVRRRDALKRTSGPTSPPRSEAPGSKPSGRGRVPPRIADNDDVRFLRGWVGNPLKMGAIAPSGQALARMMAGMIDPDLAGPILELGPGTGSMTRALIQAGIPEDRLVLIEYSASFAALLTNRYPRATVVVGDAYDVAARARALGLAPAAGIVSSLPLLTRPPEVRAGLLAEAFSILHPQGALVQFTYLPRAPITQEHIAGRVAARIDASPIVWRNLPPARVWRYRPEPA